MPAPYPNELRQRAVSAYEAGEGSQEEIAELFGICRATLQKWFYLKARTGDVEPQAPCGGYLSPVDLKVLEAIIVERPDSTSHEVTAHYNRRVPRKAQVHRSSILRALDRSGFVFKKNGIVRQNKIDRTYRPSGASSDA